MTSGNALYRVIATLSGVAAGSVALLLAWFGIFLVLRVHHIMPSFGPIAAAGAFITIVAAPPLLALALAGTVAVATFTWLAHPRRTVLHERPEQYMASENWPY